MNRSLLAKSSLAGLGGLVALVAPACTPTLEDRTSIVDAPRVLAIRATPAEALPNQLVHLEALYADASGALTVAPLDWTYCLARKPLAELGPVARECLDATSADQLVLGSGRFVDGRVPRDVCQRFGPNPPPAMVGEPSGRPVDPDVTGGYYQPTVAFRTDDPSIDPSIAQLRVLCGLASAPASVVAEFNQRYHANANPNIASLSVVRSGTTIPVPEDGAGAPATLTVGETVELSLAWPSCPETGVCGDGICSSDETRTSCASDCTTPVGCGGGETYVVYDPSSLALSERREALRVAWFSSAGTLDESRTGKDGDDRTTSSENLFTAPATVGDLVLFVVLRDERGGADYRGYRFTVSP